MSKQRGYDIKGNEAVMALTGVEFMGNIIPHSWYSVPELKLPVGKRETVGKPDLVGMLILADIVYWYRPIEIRDELTGRHMGYRKKFKGELLQRSYSAFAELFGLTKNQVTDACERLEGHALIKRYFLHPTINGLKLGNVLYIGLNAEKVINITYTPVGLEADRYSIRYGEGVVTEVDSSGNGTGIPVGLEADTNTENTTETSKDLPEIRKAALPRQKPKGNRYLNGKYADDIQH